ncbi:MAG TPA: hypothetical protein VKA15_09830, partial [Isosphaeraceae bacterium]|nr:hypothetical protein [Isosphaeraceae bacterium]
MFFRGSVAVDAVATLAQDAFGRSLELRQRHPRYYADIVSRQQLVRGDLPQFDDLPRKPPLHSAVAAHQICRSGGFDTSFPM